MAQQPSTDFFLRRLARAQAVPPDQRSPDVRAFVDSVALLREACSLLPVNGEGSPALPAGADSQRRLLRAMLCKVRADYLSPESPVADCDADGAIAAFAERSPPADLLGAALWQYCTAFTTGCCMRSLAAIYKGVRVISSSANRPMIERQLAQHPLQPPDAGDTASAPASQHPAGSTQRSAPTAQHPPGSTQQAAPSTRCETAGQLLMSPNELQFAFSCFLVRIYCELEQAELAQLPPRMWAGAQEMAATCAASLAQLEPRNPRGHMVAAMYSDKPLTNKTQQQLAEVHLSVARLAEDASCGSGLIALQASCGALMAATTNCNQSRLPAPGGHCMVVSISTVQAAVAAFERAQGALPAACRVLPALWVQGMDEAVRAVEPFLKAARAQLRVASSGRGASCRGQAVSAAQAACVGALVHSMRFVAAGEAPLCLCDNCGKHSLGLRRCARCREAQYCGKECQQEHWRTHRSTCKPKE